MFSVLFLSNIVTLRRNENIEANIGADGMSWSASDTGRANSKEPFFRNPWNLKFSHLVRRLNIL